MLPLQSNERTKVIYVFRNARDVITSFYFHLSHQLIAPTSSSSSSSSSTSSPTAEGIPFSSFEDFVAEFCGGGLYYGSWIDHIIDWFTASVSKSVLLLQYEDLLSHSEESILEIAQVP